MSQKLKIKSIDISGVNEDPEKLKEVAAIVHEECRSTGFFLLKIPEIVEKQVPSVLEAARQFFRLSLDEKQKLNNSNLSQMKIEGKSIPGTGSGFRAVSKDPNFKSDTRESYNMGPNVPTSLFNSKSYSGSGLTPWPSEDILPKWKETMEVYAHSILLSIVTALLKVFAVSLGLESDFFEQCGYFDNSTWILGLTHYFAVKSNESADVYGIRPHCDSGMFTLVLNDGRPGLQVCLDKSAKADERVWLDVEVPPPGYFIVNLGQVLERWSGGGYKATMHRVMLDGTNERWSVPFFYDPNIDLVIKPLVSVDDANNNNNYKPKSLGQMMLDRLSRSKYTFE